MSETHSHTLAEILSQPEAWTDALDLVETHAGAIRALLASHRASPSVITACGSPYYLALSAAPLLRHATGYPWLAVPASELVLHPDLHLPPNGAPLLLAFSRSGETSETIAAARAVRRRGGAILAVGCDAASTLLREADAAIAIAAGREQSVVQTRSFSAMLVAAQAIAALAGGSIAAGIGLDRLPAVGPPLIDRARRAIEPGMPLGNLARDPAIERVFILGSGTRYGLACEIALKFKEMALTAAEAFHTLEFRHGPMALADQNALVIGLLAETGGDAELAVLRHMRHLGARVAAVGEQVPGNELDAGFSFESGMPEAVRDTLYLPPLQLMVYERAVARGLNVDAPRNLSAFITLDGLA